MPKASYFDATLNGSVLNTGGEYPNVKIFWGNEDAGTTTDVDPFNNSKWDYVIDLGERGTGPFSAGGYRAESAKCLLLPCLCPEFGWCFLDGNGGYIQFQTPTPQIRPFGCLVPLQSERG